MTNASKKECRARWLFLIFVLITAQTPLRAETFDTSTDSSLALLDLSVPEEIGKIQERFTGTSTRSIIQIQDVHAHAVAQQNIAAILERLRVVFGVDKTALEGAWASASLPKSHTIPTSREKQLLAGTLLESDLVSGPAYTAIMSPEAITLVGLEDEASYEKNRSLFLAHLEKSEEIAEKLRAYETMLKGSQKLTWGTELAIFGNAFGAFRETSDLGKFFPLLCSTATAQRTVLSDLPQILLMQDILALERSFEKSRLEKEVKALMREYKNTPWTIEELIRGGKISPEKLGSYPELKKLTRLYQLRDQVSLRDLMSQIETLTGRILEKLVRTQEENALWAKTERFYLARRILSLQASPSDIRAIDEEKAALTSELAAAGLTEAFSLSLEFYEVVKQRDEIFFNKIMNDPSLAGNIAIVTGGFHTDGLSERFRAAGISYITVAPDLGGTSMNEKLYNERMTEKRGIEHDEQKTRSLNAPRSTFPASPNGQTLSELRNAIAWIDDRFPKSYEALMQTRDVRKAVKTFLGESVTVSRSDKLDRLYLEKRIVSDPKPGTTFPTSELRVKEFMATPRPEQLEKVRGWLTQGPERHEKAMLVSSLGILTKMLSERMTTQHLKEAVDSGDVIALAQDIPASEIPETLSAVRGIERFEAKDVATMIEKTPRFQRLAKKHPFAIMENNYPRGPFVVLPEKPISLVLFRIVTLDPNLYQAAKNPAFLTLLEDLVSEILSQELSKKSV